MLSTRTHYIDLSQIIHNLDQSKHSLLKELLKHHLASTKNDGEDKIHFFATYPLYLMENKHSNMDFILQSIYNNAFVLTYKKIEVQKENETVTHYEPALFLVKKTLFKSQAVALPFKDEGEIAAFNHLMKDLQGLTISEQIPIDDHPIHIIYKERLKNRVTSIPGYQQVLNNESHVLPRADKFYRGQTIKISKYNILRLDCDAHKKSANYLVYKAISSFINEKSAIYEGVGTLSLNDNQLIARVVPPHADHEKKLVKIEYIYNEDATYIENRVRHANEVLSQFPKLNCVLIWEYIKKDDCYAVYTVMNKIPGESLSHYLKNKPQISEEELYHLFLQTIEVLYLDFHKKGFIHRDVKLDNIIYNAISIRSKITYIDLDDTIPQPSSAEKVMRSPGTDGYRPPEDIISTKMDVYSLGIAFLIAYTKQALPKKPILSEKDIDILLKTLAKEDYCALDHVFDEKPKDSLEIELAKDSIERKNFFKQLIKLMTHPDPNMRCDLYTAYEIMKIKVLGERLGEDLNDKVEKEFFSQNTSICSSTSSSSLASRQGLFKSASQEIPVLKLPSPPNVLQRFGTELNLFAKKSQSAIGTPRTARKAPSETSQTQTGHRRRSSLSLLSRFGFS